MPADFSERNCIHNSDFLGELRKHMKDEQIPQYLGGTRAGCETVVQVIAFQYIFPILSSLLLQCGVRFCSLEYFCEYEGTQASSEPKMKISKVFK